MIRIINLLIVFSIVLFSCKKEATLSSSMEDTIYMRNGDSDMPAYVYGNGASNVFILVLHGGPGGNGLEYRLGSYAELLEEKYAMVYWDQRHQGNSHGHVNDEDVTLDAMVEDTHTLIQTLKKRYGKDIRVFLMGHSWGGTLGTAYMTKSNYQDELAGWIEVDGAHDIPKLNIELIKMIQTIGAEEILAGNNKSDWEEMIAFVNDLDTTAITRDQGGELNGYGHKTENLLSQVKQPKSSNAGVINYAFFSPGNPLLSTLTGGQLPPKFLEEVEKTALTNDLHKITIPTLIQWGKYDFVVPPALGYSAYAKISSVHKYLKIYEHSAHSPMANEPELFVQDIIDFIELHK